MKLPRQITDENRPFLGTNKEVKLTIDNRSRANNNNNYIASPSSPSSSSSFGNKINNIFKNSLIRWIFIIIASISLFIFVSNLIWDYNNTLYENENGVANVDFTLANLISASIGLSQMAGEKIYEIKQQHKEDTKIKGKTKEGADEFVTNADSESNKIFINGFRTLFERKGKKLNIISEEADPPKSFITPRLEYVENIPDGDKILNNDEIYIVIDPLDATTEFAQEFDDDGTNMLPYVTTLVCIVQNDKPIAGIIHRPFVTDEPVIWAAVSQGAVHHAEKKEVSKSTKELVAISRSHAGKIKEYVKPKIPLPAGGAGYKSWLVLTGKADAYLHITKIKIWDICAGHALLKSVGGIIVDKDGKELSYNPKNIELTNGLIAVSEEKKAQEYIDQLKNFPIA